KLKFELDSMTARNLLSLIPARDVIQSVFILPDKGKAKLLYSKPADNNYIKVEGVHRLRLFYKLFAELKQLKIFQIPATGGSVWSLITKNARYTLVLSGSIKHGFSGDGEALRMFNNNSIEYDAVLA